MVEKYNGPQAALRWAYPCVDARPSSASGRNKIVWLRSGSVLSDSLKVRFQVYVEVVRLYEPAGCLGGADSSIHALVCGEKDSVLQEDPHTFVVELRKSKKRSAWRIDSSMPSEIAEVCGRGAPHFHVGRVCAFEIFPTPHEDHDAPEKSRFKFFEGDLTKTCRGPNVKNRPYCWESYPILPLRVTRQIYDSLV